MNSKPENTLPKAGIGIEKPKLVTDWVSFAKVRPSESKPKAVQPQAIKVFTAMAISPAGMFLK